MIVTVTANPSIDRTLYLDTFVHHGVNRVRRVLDEPSGKGVNVALALHRMGTPVRAVLPTGGDSGAELTRLLAETGIALRTVPISGSVRTNLSLVEADGSTTKVNEPGPTVTADETDAVLAEAYAASRPGDWVAFCGSLPAGFAVAALRTAIGQHTRTGRLVVVDTSEHALRDVLAGRGDDLPHLVKPNLPELAWLTDAPLRTLGDVVAAAEQLRVRGVREILVSLGGDGAVLVDGSGALHGRAPVPRVVNTVGAGDALLAGYLHARHADLDARESALAGALLWGAVAVQHPGTTFPGRSEAQAGIDVTVGPVEPARPLSDGR